MNATLHRWLTAVLMMVPSVAVAQAPDAQPAGKDPAKSEAAVVVAPADKPATDTPHPDEPARAAVAGPTTWQPFGFLRMQYIAVQNDPNVAFVGRDDGFELQNARLGVHGVIGGRAFYTIAFDGAVDERTQVNVPQGKLAVGLRDAYVDLDPGWAGTARGPNAENVLVLRGGFFQTWTDPEAQTPELRREFVDLPIESRGMRATEGWQTPGLPPGRSLGVALRLDPEVPASGIRPGFEIAVQNGADEYSSNNDNDLPALSVAGLVRFPGGFLVAAGRWNPRTVGELPFRQDETDLQGSVGVHVEAGPLSLGGAVFVQNTKFESTGGPAQDAFGGHAQAMIRLGTIRPVAIGYRFGILDPSSLIVTDRVIEHTAGVVVGVPSLRMRLQLQLTHVVEQEGRDLSNDRAQLGMEIVL